MISITEALQDHRYIYFGGEDKLLMASSDNLTNWSVVTEYEYQDLKEPSVIHTDDTWFFLSDKALYMSPDLVAFQKLDGWPVKDLAGRPSFFQDKDQIWHVAYATSTEPGISVIRIADFDPKSQKIMLTDQTVSFVDGASNNSWQVDPAILYVEGVYYLATAGNYVYSSNKYTGNYGRVPTNFSAAPNVFGNQKSHLAGWLGAPQLVLDGTSIRLFAEQPDGTGLVYRSADRDNIFDWSDSTTVQCKKALNGGTLLVNEKVTAEVPVEEDDTPHFNTHMSIRTLHGDTDVPLVCYKQSSVQYQYEDNQTNQLQMVVYNDGSPGYTCVANESVITFNDDLFVIKQVEEDDQGTGLLTVTAVQYVNSEISRVVQRTVKNGQLTYTVQDVLDFFLNDKVANPFGFSYHAYGDFGKQQIENLGNMSGKDMISKIIETWPGTIVVPYRKRLDVYAPGTLARNHNRRIVYKYNTSNMKMVEDSTGIINQLRCIGATKDDSDTSSVQGNLSQTVTDTTITTGADHTADFQADAKKYLGVPYVWGGHNKANPWAGMDCSGYVSQVYHDFGIEIPAYTVAMENNFREIPYSEVKPGDVGFYGPHGGTHHICLMLDHNTMIYEPQEGEVCKTAPVSSYAPSWYGRNDQMQAKINTKKTETVENLHLSYSDGSGGTSTQTAQQYYFQPFIITDNNSWNEWGPHPAPNDLQDDRFKDPESMRKYAVKQLVPEPKISVEVVMKNNEMPIIGEQRNLTIPHRRSVLGDPDNQETTQDAYTTTVTAVGFTWYPYDKNQGTDVTYDNLPATLLHARLNNDSYLHRIEQLANATLDRMPQVFYSNQDPSANQTVRNGAIWIKPNDTKGDVDNGGQTKPSTDK